MSVSWFSVSIVPSVLSIDIFRGFTIFMMVFVNDLAGVKDIPQWMKHMPADADAMTFVDVVFPAFLFIVGMVIPTAIQNRIRKGQSFIPHLPTTEAQKFYFRMKSFIKKRKAMRSPAFRSDMTGNGSALLRWNAK